MAPPAPESPPPVRPDGSFPVRDGPRWLVRTSSIPARQQVTGPIAPVGGSLRRPRMSVRPNARSSSIPPQKPPSPRRSRASDSASREASRIVVPRRKGRRPDGPYQSGPPSGIEGQIQPPEPACGPPVASQLQGQSRVFRFGPSPDDQPGLRPKERDARARFERQPVFGPVLADEIVAERFGRDRSRYAATQAGHRRPTGQSTLRQLGQSEQASVSGRQPPAGLPCGRSRIQPGPDPSGREQPPVLQVTKSGRSRRSRSQNQHPQQQRRRPQCPVPRRTATSCRTRCSTAPPSPRIDATKT